VHVDLAELGFARILAVYLEIEVLTSFPQPSTPKLQGSGNADQVKAFRQRMVIIMMYLRASMVRSVPAGAAREAALRKIIGSMDCKASVRANRLDLSSFPKTNIEIARHIAPVLAM
jgi:hypothetical protein